MKKLKDLTGKTIKIKKTNQKVIEDIINHINNANAAIDYATNKLRKNSKKLWETIHQLYPEIIDYKCTTDGEVIHVSYNSKLELKKPMTTGLDLKNMMKDWKYTG